MSPIFKKSADVPTSGSPAQAIVPTPLELARRVLDDARMARDELEEKAKVAAQTVVKLEREFLALFTNTPHPAK